MLYTDNKNQQILQALLIEHGVKYVIASPGGTNPAMVMSLQEDSHFKMYSCVDERSAAYMACGLAEETGEPVAICCTGATASRNYMPALTEAYYRKLPIVVITCSRPNYHIGHLFPQVTNRNIYLADTYIDGEQLQVIKDETDRWDVEFKINKGLVKMKQRGGGPIHFNVETTMYSCTTKSLPHVNKISLVTQNSSFPCIEAKRVGIFIGAHKMIESSIVNKIEMFCEQHNAVVFCDHTSGYKGKYTIPFALLGTQQHDKPNIFEMDLLIHLGEQSGDYLTMESICAKHVWRLSEDGEIRIRFGKLDYIFEMPDYIFWNKYTENNSTSKMTYFQECSKYYDILFGDIPELPLGHMYIAKTLAPQMPMDCTVHFSIINALRAWNFFKLSPTIKTNCNVGGFGIDGCTSSLIGASLSNSEKLYFLFSGDLAFFYDLNSIGNRHIGNNVRILLLNDGMGAEFTHYRAPNYEGDRTEYIAAAGHYGSKSPSFVKGIAESMGFRYLTASTKENFLKQYSEFINPKISGKPILFEIFADVQGQSESWKLLSELSKNKEADNKTTIQSKLSSIKKLNIFK